MKKILLAIGSILFINYSGYGQWTSDTLSEAKYGMSVCAINDKALFAQGNLTANNISGKVEIYNASTGIWNTHILSVNRNSPVSVVIGNKVMYAGGQFTWNTFSPVIDIYDDSTGNWTTKNLSLGRKVGAAGVVGDKAIFAGGITRNVDVYMFSNKVDIYNNSTNTWSKSKLSQSRSAMATATAGNKIAFAGGVYMSTLTWEIVPTRKVDIYDNVAGIWSTAMLSVARQDISSASVGSKMIFAGGWTYATSGAVILKDKVDIYDATTNTWSTANLSTPRYGMKVSVIGSKVYFAGGTAKTNSLSKRIDIYDSATNTWSFINMPAAKTGYAKVDMGNRIFYAGGAMLSSNTLTNTINIYDVVTNTWSMDYLPVNRYMATAVRVLNTAIFAGGLNTVAAPYIPVNRIDLYADPNLRTEEVSQTELQFFNEYRIYPNPFIDKIFIQRSTDDEAVVSIYDVIGKLHFSTRITDQFREVDMQSFKSGIYFLRIIEGDKPSQTLRIIKNSQ